MDGTLCAHAQLGLAQVWPENHIAQAGSTVRRAHDELGMDQYAAAVAVGLPDRDNVRPATGTRVLAAPDALFLGTPV